jgi:hypothetical protein
MLGALALQRRLADLFLRLLSGLLLHLLLGLLLLLSDLLLLSFSIDILNKCLVVLFILLKFFLDYSQFIF